MSNKENIPTETKRRSKKSVVSQENLSVCNQSTRIVNQTIESQDDISDKLSGYIDYVKKLEESQQKILRENHDMSEEKRKEMIELRKTYDDEIKALRIALDNVASEKVGLGIELKKKSEDFESLKSKYTHKSESLLLLQRKYDDLEDQYLHVKRKLTNIESSHDDYENNERKINAIQDELKIKTYMAAELENRIETLKEEVAFYKKLNQSESKICPIIDVKSERENEIDADEYEELKKSIRYDFEERLDTINESYNSRIDDLTKINEDLLEKNKVLNSDIRKLRSIYENATKLLAQKESKICELNNTVSNHTNELAAIGNSYEQKNRSMIDEIDQLRQDLNKKIVEISKHVSEKTSLESKLYLFQSLLDGEQSRCNLDTSISSRKRKLIDDNKQMNVSASSIGKIRIACDENFSGDYLILINDLDREINLNEWKLEICDGSEENIIYTFPPFILKAGNVLKIWNNNEEVEENENNLILDVALPHNIEFNCKLNNDMNECEASFELKKILKPKRSRRDKTGEKKPSCLLM